MALSPSTDPKFASGEIKFSELRNTFKGSGTEIKASELFRDTDTNQSNPVVPDATENANISSDGTNLSLLGFRNCIKTYDIKQDIGEIDTNVNLTTATWNSNLSKNIRKSFIVEGTIGSTNPINPALTLSGVVRNFTIDVRSSGKIQGAGGAAGNVSINHGSSDTRRTGYVAGDGQDGGEAISLDTSATDADTKIIKVQLASGSKVYAGGGGGGVGSIGGTGGTGATVQGMNGGTGGTGGNPGNGGVGRGYNNTTFGVGQTGSDGGDGGDGDTKQYRLSDSSEIMTTYTFSAGNGGKGGTGGTGGNGGNWGSDGNTGSSTGVADGSKGSKTETTAPDNPIIYKVPSNPFTGMTIEYSNLYQGNLVDGDKGTPFSSTDNPVTNNGATIGYKTLKFKNSGGTIGCTMEIQTASSDPASNPRFTTDGNGLVADSSGNIKVQCSFNGGSAVEQITINANNSSNNKSFIKSGNNTVTHEFAYEPNITNGNLVSFGVFREAGHQNFITFGGKYDNSKSNHIDPTGTIPTFGPGTDNILNTVCHDIATGETGPVWGVDTNVGTTFAIKGIQVYTDIFGDGLTGIQLDDNGGGTPDEDFNDLIIIPLIQSGIEFNDRVLPPDPPSLPAFERVGGTSGYSIKKLGTASYSLTGNENLLGLYSNPVG